VLHLLFVGVSSSAFAAVLCCTHLLALILLRWSVDRVPPVSDAAQQ
jgi:hypothetical protein